MAESERGVCCVSFSDEDKQRFEAWVAYRERGEWNCPRCGFNRHHYNGGHYCSGCHSPVSVICLWPASPEEQARSEECRRIVEARERA